MRLDHAYTQSNLRTVGTQTEPMHPPVATLAPRSSPPQSTSRPTTPQPSSDEPAPSSESDVEPLPSSDYEPASASTSESIESDEDEDSHRNKYIVFEASLDELMKFCCRCGSPVLTRSRFTTGTMVSYRLGCHAGHDYLWRSQPVVSRAPLGNMLLSAAILFPGLSYTSVSDLARCLGLLFLSHSTYYENQKTTLFPVLQEAWELEREGAALEVHEGGPATLAGDARCDTPGHSAKYGSYTLMHVDGHGQKGSNRIVAMELVQVSEVSNISVYRKQCASDVSYLSIIIKTNLTAYYNYINILITYHVYVT